MTHVHGLAMSTILMRSDCSQWYSMSFDYALQILLFECASGAGVVAGMESEHDNGADDRR